MIILLVLFTKFYTDTMWQTKLAICQLSRHVKYLHIVLHPIISWQLYTDKHTTTQSEIPKELLQSANLIMVPLVHALSGQEHFSIHHRSGVHLHTDGTLQLQLQLLDIRSPLAHDFRQIGNLSFHVFHGNFNWRKFLLLVVHNEDSLLDVRKWMRCCTSIMVQWLHRVHSINPDNNAVYNLITSSKITFYEVIKLTTVI